VGLSNIGHGGGTNNAQDVGRNIYRDICGHCGAVRLDAQLGLESTPEEYVGKVVEGFREVRRVLRKDGTLWLNLGDSYAGGGNYRGLNSESTLTEKQRSNRGARGVSQQLGAAGKETGCKPKDLVGIPWMVAFALRADGWYLRQDIIWAKPNPMPESVTDRCTKSHEYLFLLSKSRSYYFDAEAILEDAAWAYWGEQTIVKGNPSLPWMKGRGATERERLGKRNKRSVWTITTSPYKEAHFATFPPKLVMPCVLAGTEEGGVVLDPFNGAGTTGLVATRLNRNYIGIELNPEYCQMARRRMDTVCPLFNQELSGEELQDECEPAE
jgi:DNA modification methylase